MLLFGIGIDMLSTVEVHKSVHCPLKKATIASCMFKRLYVKVHKISNVKTWGCMLFLTTMVVLLSSKQWFWCCVCEWIVTNKKELLSNKCFYIIDVCHFLRNTHWVKFKTYIMFFISICVWSILKYYSSMNRGKLAQINKEFSPHLE
mgnify:CR=1 FL=1